MELEFQLHHCYWLQGLFYLNKWTELLNIVDELTLLNGNAEYRLLMYNSLMDEKLQYQPVLQKENRVAIHIHNTSGEYDHIENNVVDSDNLNRNDCNIRTKIRPAYLRDYGMWPQNLWGKNVKVHVYKTKL